MRRVFAGIAMLAVLLLPHTLWAQAQAAAAPKAARPTQVIAQENCVTVACHANVKNYTVVHGPVNVNACDACHKLTDPAKHTFEAPREKSQTCTFCHKMDLSGGTVIHKPLQTGDCLPCHNPHGGKTGKFLRGESMSQMCQQCHKDNMAGKRFQHGPAAAGACQSCHSPHVAKFPKLLVAEGRELCLGCHKEMGQQMQKVKFTHKAVTQGQCTDCHDPHASDYPMQTKAAGEKLCTTCHEKIKKAALEAPHKHTVVTKDQACLNCHTPHGGDLARLMKSEPIKVCMKCHNKPITQSKERTISSIAEVLDKKMVKHGPIADGNCTACHNVHGSEVSRLLIKPYPDAFYQGFDLEKYGLCFTCHDKQLVLLQRTTGLTGFRNGDENLHFVHVNKVDRGRSCRACHSTHASPNALHVRDSVPYGSWQMPINYKKVQTGGTCSPGCHKPFTYDRETPQTYEPPSGALATPAEKDSKS